MLIIILFYARHCYYYAIVSIANNTMNKCCNVKLQVVYDNIHTHVVLYYYIIVSMGIVL